METSQLICFENMMRALDPRDGLGTSPLSHQFLTL